MNAHQIRAWLLQQPRASSLRVHVGKEKSDIAVAGQSWAKLAGTIEAMAPDQIQALDAGGNILRAVRPADVDDVDEDAKPAQVVASPPPQAYDPETVRFELVAKLVAEAYRHSTEIAFTKMVDIVNAMGRRSESLERSLASAERVLRKQAEDLFDEAAAKAAESGGEGDLAKQMVNGFLQSAMGGGETAPPNGKAKA
jgi:hypothetical protein